jgi:5-methyltetrahydrofolate--homocysteine methyltransferase
MGDTPEACVESAAGAGASVIGANCGNGIDVYVNLARALRALTDKPLWIKANAGVPEISGGKTVYPMNPADYCAHIPALLDAGVNIVGGCCGTSPEFIRTARKIIR